MFYIFNNKSNKQLKSDPYKKILKELTNNIRELDNDTISFLKNSSSHLGIPDTEELLLLIHHNKELTYKEIEKKLKKIYSTNSFEELFYYYVVILNNSLYKDFIIKSALEANIPLEQVDPNHEETIITNKLQGTLATIAFYSILFNENLLERKIEFLNISEQYSESKPIKLIKPEPMSLLKGIHNIPILLTYKEADLVTRLSKKLILEGYDHKILDHMKLIYTYRFLEYNFSMYCFGKDFNSFINNKEFIGEEAFRIAELKMAIIPTATIKERKIIPPKDGVVLKLKNHKTVESIYLNECSRFNLRIIYGVARFKNGSEQPISMRLNSNEGTILYCYDTADISDVILDFYKCPEVKPQDEHNIIPVPEYEVLSATYWNYRNKGYETEKEHNQRVLGKKVQLEHTVKIGTRVKTIKTRASKEIREFADKIQLTLADNETVVRERNRNYTRNEY